MKKPIRVLYISPVAERGGAERVLYNLVKFHNRDVCEPFVFFLKDGPFVKEILKLGIPVYVYDAGRLRYIWKYLQAVHKIISFIKDKEIDIVHGNSSMGYIYGGLAALIAKRRRVWFQHTCSRKFDMIDKIATMIPSDYIIANSFYTASLQKRISPDRKNIIVIYPGIDLSEFNPDTAKGKEIRDMLGIKPAEKVVGIVGRIQRWKGHAFFIDAMDILVHASINPEPFGFVICEGMALKKTVIATDAGGPQEIITGPEIGYLYETGNSLKLAELIIRFLNDPEEMEKVGIMAEKHIHENFSVDKMVDKIENLYREMLENE